MAVTALRQNYSSGNSVDRLREIIRTKSLMRGDSFNLSSGETSDYFFNMKMTMLDPEGANLIAEIILDCPELEGATSIGGLEMGAVPIVSVVSARSFYTTRAIPAFFVRKERKGHGTNLLIDGYLKADTRVVLVDDVTTTGGSVMKAIDAARGAGCTVDTVITVVDRLEGAKNNLRQKGIQLVALYTRADFED